MKGQSLLQRVVRKLDKTIAARSFIDQWVLLTGPRLGYRELDWKKLRPLIPPQDRYWGDPFPVFKDQSHFIFFEEKLYAKGIGRIACMTLDREGNPSTQRTVLERPYHLSYPFIFEHGPDLFMIPETADNRTVELYRCTRFPDRWEFVRNLLSDIYAVDATVLNHEGKYWLFANVKTASGSSLDALHLYCAADLMSGAWTPHPKNPVVHDVRSARPAGRIFVEDGALIRPAQDSSRRYGYALRFNRITTLSETEYAEASEASFTPRGSKYLATHTFNQAGDITVLDAVLRRRKQ